MERIGMVKFGKEAEEEVVKRERKKRLINAFTLLNLTSDRAQKLLQQNRHSFSVEACLRRIDKYTGSTVVDDVECNQITTRASTVFSKKLKEVSSWFVYTLVKLLMGLFLILSIPMPIPEKLIPNSNVNSKFPSGRLQNSKSVPTRK